MEKLVCSECGKKIEGYTLKHVRHLMSQHHKKHIREERKLKEKELKQLKRIKDDSM